MCELLLLLLLHSYITYGRGSKWLLHALTMIFLSLCYIVCIVLACFTLVNWVSVFFQPWPLTHTIVFSILSSILHSAISFFRSILSIQWAPLNCHYDMCVIYAVWIRRVRVMALLSSVNLSVWVCVKCMCVSGRNEVLALHLMHLMHIQALGLSICFVA